MVLATHRRQAVGGAQGGVGTPRFCLIGGTGRSGTTVLAKILALHPALADVPEWRFLVDPDGLMDFYAAFKGSWSPYLYDVKLRRLTRLLRRVGRHRRLSRVWDLVVRSTRVNRLVGRHLVAPYASINVSQHCPRFQRFVDALLEDLGGFRYEGDWVGSELLQRSQLSFASAGNGEGLGASIAAFYRRVAVDVVTRQGAQCYLEKNTWNILWFDHILEVLPEATLVHIHRDPRDVVASYTRQRWAPSDPVQAAYFYKDIMERWWVVRARTPERSWMEVSLASLVEEPQRTLESICDFWGLDWDDALLSVDLTRSNAGRWRREFSLAQQRQVCRILEPVLAALRYDS